MSLSGCLMAALLLGAQEAGAQDWEALAERPSDPTRGALVLERLRDRAVELTSLAQNLAFEDAQRAAEAFELDLSLELFRSLVERTDAPWARYNLAIVEHRAGDFEASDALLADMLASQPAVEAAGLWSQRGIFAWGAGNDSSALRHFGQALARGSADASAILAREALGRHNLGPARTGFRAALERDRAHPWALRGWGLALLTPKPANASTLADSTD